MAASPQPSAPIDDPGASPGAGPQACLWQELGWTPDSGQLAALVALQEQLRQWNSRVNLTRLVEGDDFWIAQVFDSLWPWVPLLTAPGGVPEGLELIDVGTGGGFPGLALAIALPTARLTLVDSVGRKLEAVGAMARSLGLEGRISLRCERVERTGRRRDCRGHFDRAMARAVAGAPVVAEYLVPLLKPGGLGLLYRGQWGAGDQRELEAAVAVLRATVEPAQRRDLPAGRGVRHGLWLRPAGPCPAAYPRAVGVPQRQPISSRPS
ncbi:16S rRNA (guanine(527)-N(7))-methyltransferase RsmG [Synechococcus sp. CCY 9618]|uniref:16S rRNA (guanine(527)-N(7))-methyltransferase RsmG n=1 Tax=Synechococcus sp. CCY 9618 TaxID=2815602 RepID=UPI001C23E9CC|nr:16S rRNA (guanine(527)-N(7))-methyltransferase RsmG [Synechococcus sp. CCY 9618]